MSKVLDKCSNGKEALEAVNRLYYQHSRQYATIITDLSMPIMDGFEESINIRNFMQQKMLPHPKIIACTGHSEPEYIEKAWRYQIDEVI